MTMQMWAHMDVGVRARVVASVSVTIAMSSRRQPDEPVREHHVPDEAVRADREAGGPPIWGAP